jgi:hypothetical protein
MWKSVAGFFLISNSLFLPGDHKPPIGIVPEMGLRGLFKDLVEFMNIKSDEIRLEAVSYCCLM